MKSPTQQPYDIKERELEGFDSYDAVARYLCEEIDNAIATRGPVEFQLDYWHRIYEQDRTRLEANRPKANGADLTTYLGTQYVDAMHARIMKTIFTGRPWVVEGWGESASKAPFVEEFHAWTFEDERGQAVMDQVIQNALIDSEGILEVSEGNTVRCVRKTIWAQVQTVLDEMGQPRALFNEKNEPLLVTGPDGKYAEVPPPVEGEPVPAGMAQVTIDSYEYDRLGPEYDIIDFRDFYTLPGHARSRREVWGYAKRFYRRVPVLTEMAEKGVYDPKAVEAIGDDNDREQTLDDSRRGVTVGRQEGHTAEKELFEVPLLINLDGKGERWWLATVSHREQKLLRLKFDELATEAGVGRFVRWVPYPRKNSTGGLSLIGHKLITILEEHTATRNIRADRAALAAQPPIKVQQGALYDPEEQPFGTGAVIWVRDMNEVQAFELPDVTRGMETWGAECISAAERTVGLTDSASGVTPEERRTATELRITTATSEVRVDLVTKRCQEPFEDLFHIRQAVWKRALRSQPEGMDIPQRVQSGLEARAIDIAPIQGGKFTADLLEGKFRGKPRGSVETADPALRRVNFNGLLQVLPAVMQTNPMVAMMLQTPTAARALLEMTLDVYNVEDKQAFLGQAGQQAVDTAQLLQSPEIQGLLGTGGMGGAGTTSMSGTAGLASPAGPPPPAMPGMGIQ